MKDPRLQLNEKEKLARVATNNQTNPSTYFVANEQAADDLKQLSDVNKFNDRVDAYIKDFDEHANKLNEYGEALAEKMDGLEIKPVFNYLLVKPFKENPFQKITTTKSGLIVDLGGKAPGYKDDDTGEYKEEECFIHVGVVVDAGPKCDYTKEGDVIMWTKTSEVPVPFYKQGLVVVNEQRVLVVINEGLSKRFNGDE
jgi:hypothetical protein